MYRDFLEDVKYSVSENISGLLDRAFSTLDHEGTRSVDLNKVISLYDSSKHPHVITRKKYPEDVKQEFINGISRKAKDGRISKEAFIDYYA